VNQVTHRSLGSVRPAGSRSEEGERKTVSGLPLNVRQKRECPDSYGSLSKMYLMRVDFASELNRAAYRADACYSRIEASYLFDRS
jgi:hypothetical protein